VVVDMIRQKKMAGRALLLTGQPLKGHPLTTMHFSISVIANDEPHVNREGQIPFFAQGPLSPLVLLLARLSGTTFCESCAVSLIP